MLVESSRSYPGPAETRKAHFVRTYFTYLVSLEPQGSLHGRDGPHFER